MAVAARRLESPAPPIVTRQRTLMLAALLTAGLAWGIIYRALPPLSTWLTYQGLRLEPGTRLASAVEFFAYDTPKVLMLLLLVVFGMGVVRSFFSPVRTRRLMAGRRELTGNVLASLLGIVTPFCSCSAVPLFIGFVTAGIPLGVTFSFLISAPMVNEVALVLLFGLFGWRIAALYAATGVSVAIVAGWTLGRLPLERWIEPWVLATRGGVGGDELRLSIEDRLAEGWQAVRDVIGRVWPYVIAGIAVGAAIHGYVPEDFMAGIMGRKSWWAVPLAVLLGIPMYTNAAGIIPIVQALLEKGAALGTALAFMMAVIGLSLPEMVILRKVLRVPLILTFAGVVGAGILLVGYLFNALL
jgi:uncharacterized membrane protein YraQ (UPF0718 family)